MKQRTNPLAQVRIAAPCPADWERMIGNEQVRFCALCNLNVYNLSGMTRLEAEQLIAQREGRLCVRYYRKADGTILTKNCPVGLKALKRRLTRTTSAVVSLLLSFFAGIFAFLGLQKSPTPTRYEVGQLIAEPEERLKRTTAQQEQPVAEAGEVVTLGALDEPAPINSRQGKSYRGNR